MTCRGPRGIELGLSHCHLCGLTLRGEGLCPRCGEAVHLRVPGSLQRTWALLIAAMLLYVPANAFPIMHTSALGDDRADTILEGVVYFLTEGEWAIALVIFVASVLVPLLKMLALLYLLTSVRRRSPVRPRERTRIYRLTEVIGRWSMVDVFVVALMVALVHLGQIARITPGPGALAFAAVVILTMLAASAFDPRLIWDHLEPRR